MVRTRCYRGGKVVAENFAVADVSEYVADSANTVWFDLCRPDRKDLEILREELGLHDLAIEDVLDADQRPKIDRYPEHLFLIAYSLEIAPATQLPRGHEVSVFITHNALVTVRADEGFDIDAVMKQWDSTVDLSGSGVAYLLHGLLDYVVDTHYDAVQAMDTLVDGL